MSSAPATWPSRRPRPPGGAQRRGLPEGVPARQLPVPGGRITGSDVAPGGQLWGSVLLVAVGVLCAVAVVWTMLVGSYGQFVAVLVALGLLAITVPFARHAARMEAWPNLAWILMGSMALKLLGALARDFVTYGVYGGVADASTYTSVALSHYHAFRHLHFFVPTTGVFHGLLPFIATLIYAVTGPSELGSFFVFSWISFIGLYLFYRAFRIAYPEGNGRRYAMLVFFLPGLLYWPSSLGKEAWMVLAIGLACYGLARILAGRAGGYVSFMAGIGAMLLVRPHLALIVLPAAIVAFLLRRSRPGQHGRPIGKLVGVAVMVISSLVVVAKVQTFFGITNLDPQSITGVLNTVKTQTDIGGSAFQPPDARTPVGYVEAVVTVLYRPFPWDARSKTVLVASAEGLLLLGITLASWRRLKRLPDALWRNPYVLFSFLYTALFILAFSSFSNFGILARERVQMLPLFLVLLAIPPGASKADGIALAGVHHQPRGRWANWERARLRAAAVGSRRLAPIGPASPRMAPHRPSTTPGAPVLRSPAVAAMPLARVGSYRALGHSFEVEADDPSLGRSLTATLSDLSDTGPADHCYRLTTADRADALMFEVALDGETLGGPWSPVMALTALVTDLNRQAAASRPDHLLLHAAALSWAGRGLVLPAPPGGGKTTLAAGLIAAGFAYLTDEVVAIHPVTLEIEPYPKPLSVDPGAVSALRHLGVLGGSWVWPLPGEPWLVAADTLGTWAAGDPCRANLLVFPSYQAGATTALTPLGRAEALVEVASNSFNFVEHGSAWLPILRRLVLECSCWRLTTGDLEQACELLMRLAAGEEERR
jgi:hypothetical protein